MAKMTIDDLITFAETYVDADKQAAAYEGSTDNFLGLVDKIGKIVTIDGSFQDKLAWMDGDNLPYATTIEEWLMDLTLGQLYTDIATEAANDVVPQLPSVEDAAYSFDLKRYYIKTTEPYGNVESAALDASSAAQMIGKILQRLENSKSMTKYAEKKQLIGNLLTKIDTALATQAGLATEIAIPTDSETGAAFIEQVKKCAEDASFANEGNNLGNCYIGAASDLVLFVKKGIVPNLQVQTMVGAFNKEDLAIPARVQVVDDFGSYDGATYAVLVDERTIRLHNHYSAVRSQAFATSDRVDFVAHESDVGFISKFTYVHAFKAPQAAQE